MEELIIQVRLLQIEETQQHKATVLTTLAEDQAVPLLTELTTITAATPQGAIQHRIPLHHLPVHTTTAEVVAEA